MALNPGGASYNWNYSNDQKDGFSLEMTGTVVSIQEVQAREWNQQTRQPGKPKTWPDGNPVWNIRMGFAMPDGNLKTFTFAEAGKKQMSGEKPSVHVQLYNLTGNMMDLMGKTVHIITWREHPGEHPLLGYFVNGNGETEPCPWNTDALKGQPWRMGNPRLFAVELVDGAYDLRVPLPDEYKVPKLLADDGAHGGQPVAQMPQQIQVPQVPPMQGQFYAPPMPQQYAQQPMYQQPMPTIQAMPPQTAPMPQGMDPAVAAAMQMTGAQNVQPVGVYEDIPF